MMKSKAVIFIAFVLVLIGGLDVCFAATSSQGVDTVFVRRVSALFPDAESNDTVVVIRVRDSRPRHQASVSADVPVVQTLPSATASEGENIAAVDPDSNSMVLDDLVSGTRFVLTPEEENRLVASLDSAIVAQFVDPNLVIVGNDTVSAILPQRNFGRYDRGLFNHLFIPKGQWMFGLTASYGEISTKDIELFSVITDVDLTGKIYSIKPSVSYAFTHNQTIGMQLNYSRTIGDVASLGMDIDADMSFALKDVSYYSHTYTAALVYRNYIGFDNSRRFAVFNEVNLGFGSGSSRFKRLYDGEMRDTRTIITEASLNFSPGLCVFIQQNFSFNVSFGVFGVKLHHEKQSTNGVPEGSRLTSGANFRFNIFNINFGLGVHI